MVQKISLRDLRSKEMAEMYYETDADLSVLEDKIIGIVGYGLSLIHI